MWAQFTVSEIAPVLELELLIKGVVHAEPPLRRPIEVRFSLCGKPRISCLLNCAQWCQ